ncbi:MAG: PDZ domain-containing protein, partial [Gemmataceae bacterium]|nr:PDZ domain-containing protein [Gemmataceae bacterium]
SANAKSGLAVGDVILSIDGKKISDARAMAQGFGNDRKAGDKVKVEIQRGEDKKEFTLVLEATSMAMQGRGGGTTSRPYGAQLAGQRENVQNTQGAEGFQTGGVYKSTDAGVTWTRVNSMNPRPMYFSVVRVDPTDDQKLYVLGVTMSASTDGGKTFKSYGNNGVHADQHDLWINPKDPRHMIVGSDGGFYVTYDRMAHWEHVATLPLGQFYHVGLDNRLPYNVYGGLQDNGSWGGPSRTLRGTGPVNEDWIVVNGGDGFVSRADPVDPDWVFAESQDGNVMRRNLKTGEGGMIRYRPRANEPTARYNWNTPYILSAFNPKIIYVGGDRVFRSVAQGTNLRPISPELTKSKRGTLTALAESPKNAEVLWAGSDDGALWVTRDGGAKWENVYDKLGAPAGRWVATIEAGRTVEGRAYVALDAHRSNDDKPYVFVTEDFGKTWKNIGSTLPQFGSTRCLREDPINPNLLLCGTEFAAFASIDRGAHWTKINNNLPTVAVHEFAIHPTQGEVVAATHGRSLWIMDITPLRQMKTESLTAPATLYAPNTAVRAGTEPARGAPYGGGQKKYYGENPPAGAGIYYSLTKPAEKVTLKVVDFEGKTIRELPAKKEAGLHKVQWDLTRPSLRTAFGLQAGTELPEEAMRRPGGLFGSAVPAGSYRVVLIVDGVESSQPLKIESDPNSTSPSIALDEEE